MNRRTCDAFPLLLIGLLLGGGGCQPADTDRTAADRTDRDRTDTGTSDTLTARPGPAAASSPAEETVWDLVQMAGQPIGHQSLTFRRVVQGNQVYYDATAESRLVIQRFGQAVAEEMQVASREDASGDVLRVESRTKSGGQSTEIVGRRIEDVLQLGAPDGHAGATTIPLPSPCGGYFAVEWSLRKVPLGPGERRNLQAVIPMLNQVATVQLLAHDWELTDLPGGSQRLLRIDQQLILSPDAVSQLSTVIWCDTTGGILKSEMAALQQVSYRVDRATALAGVASPPTFDLGRLATVPVAEPIDQPHTSQLARYRIRVGSGNALRLFPTTPTQSVTEVDDRTVEVRVQARRPGATTPPGDSPPDAADLGASTAIESTDPVIQALAAELPAEFPDRWTEACAIERFVGLRVTEKDFSTGFASAADVARTFQGDCTEHAVLTAALCRARGIPARVLVGLVYVASQRSFIYHMWNEVWVQDQWIPIDATLGQGGTGAAHLILARSSLADGNGWSAFLPVIQVLGQMEIEVLEVQMPQPLPTSGRLESGVDRVPPGSTACHWRDRHLTLTANHSKAWQAR